METSFLSTAPFFRNSCRIGILANPNPNFIRINKTSKIPKGAHNFPVRIRAINEVAGDADPIQAQITWEIVIGALAGVIPFVVAGIEFRKRIVAQQRCVTCKGSGLVRREKYYFRCPRCGGFLPWQSWKRFFSG